MKMGLRPPMGGSLEWHEQSGATSGSADRAPVEARPQATSAGVAAGATQRKVASHVPTVLG